MYTFIGINRLRWVAGLSCACIAASFVPNSGVANATSRRVAKSFVLSLPSDSQTITAGSAAAFPFTLKRTGGFRGVVTFDVTGVPLGVGINARVVSRSTTRYEVEVSTSATTPGESTVYFLRARSGTVQKSVPFRLTIKSLVTTTLAPAPTTSTTSSVPATTAPTGDFSLFADIQPSTTRTVAPGESATFGIRVERRSFTSPITLKVEGLPTGSAASFNPNPSQTNADLNITTTATAPSGTYLLVVTGTASGLTRVVAVRLVIRRAGPFLLSASPTALTVNAGNDAVINITVAVPAGATVLSDVTVALIGAPPGVTLQTPVVEGRTTRFVLATSPDTAAGTYKLTAAGQSGTFTQRLDFTLTVTRQTQGFGISAQPTSLTLKQGAAGEYDVKLVALSGFNGPVAFSVTGLPTTVASSIETTPTGVTVKLTTTLATPATSYPLLITGKNGVLSATVAVTLVVITTAV